VSGSRGSNSRPSAIEKPRSAAPPRHRRDPAAAGRLVPEGRSGHRPGGPRAQRVAGREQHRPDRAVGDQRAGRADGRPVLAQREVGERVVRGGHERAQVGIGGRPDQRGREHAGEHDQAARPEDRGERAGEQAAEPAGERHARPEAERHPPDRGQRAADAEVGADVVVVGEQAEHTVGEGGGQHDQDLAEDRPPAPGSPRGEAAGLAGQEPGQERLGQGLLHVQALDDVEHGAAGEQDDRGHQGGPVPAAQPAGQQQQPDPGGGHGHGGAARHRHGHHAVEQP
jgi:hypothetical protein